jgi:class 3 adenylate cyclase
VLKHIKENSAWRAIPVIVISGRQDMDGIISCIEAGADDYLFKPFNQVLLQARITAGLERKRWHDREEQYRMQLERNEQFIRATFGRYVSDEVVANLLEKPEGLKLGGDLREVTILMSDIRAFSTICERLPPDQVMKMLNNYLGTMSEIIMGHQGTIDEFIGDAILAIFGAPISRPDDADRAVQCALDMQQAMNDINRDNREAGLPEISMGIGVNTGAVIAGNIGSEKRSKYGVVGHHVNLTARIESQTAGGEVLISETTRDKLNLAFGIGEQKQVRVKGIKEPVSIYQVLSGGEEAPCA